MSWVVLACHPCLPETSSEWLQMGMVLAAYVLVWLVLPMVVAVGLIWLVLYLTRKSPPPSPVAAAGPPPPPPPPRGEVWARGERPNGSALDVPARIALERIWLAQARREHGLVAALGRTAWLLTAAGAPAELVLRMQRAGMAKVGHAQTCFALAAGYGRRTLGVEPRPELLEARFDEKSDPLVVLAREVTESGCLFSGFRAALAHEGAAGCTEPTAREALTTIAGDDAEREALSWAVLEWMLEKEPGTARPSARRIRNRLQSIDRPLWVTPDAEPWVKQQRPEVLAPLGVVPPHRVQALFDRHLKKTRARLDVMLGPERTTASEASSYE